MKLKTLIWLDDMRDPFGYYGDAFGSWLVFSPIQEPFNVVWVKSHQEFIDWININGLPDAICFDHDLGDCNGIEEKTGYDSAKFLVEYCIDNEIELPLYNIQSANPVGKENIDSLLKNFIKHHSKE